MTLVVERYATGGTVLEAVCGGAVVLAVHSEGDLDQGAEGSGAELADRPANGRVKEKSGV